MFPKESASSLEENNNNNNNNNNPTMSSVSSSPPPLSHKDLSISTSVTTSINISGGSSRRTSGANRAAYLFAIVSIVLIVGLLGPSGLILSLHEEQAEMSKSSANNLIRPDSARPGGHQHQHQHHGSESEVNESEKMVAARAAADALGAQFPDPSTRVNKNVQADPQTNVDDDTDDADDDDNDDDSDDDDDDDIAPSKMDKMSPSSSVEPKRHGSHAREEFNPIRIGKKNKTKNKQKPDTPFPVYNYNDDVVKFKDPIATTPADALECRSSVKEFIINATDVKDECSGLRKAFDTTCGGLVGEPGAQRRRRLMGEPRHVPLGTMPQEKWIEWTARHLRVFGRTWFRQRPKMEDEILGYVWAKATYTVQNNFDQTDQYIQQISTISLKEGKRRRLDETKRHHAEGADNNESHESHGKDNNNDAKDQNKVKNTSSQVKKPLLSPKLPTENNHVGGQLLNDAVMLTEGSSNQDILRAANRTNGTTAESVLVDEDTSQSSKNVTIPKEQAEALLDAETSSAAIKKATEVVSAVLSDPDSVEARTCCASILNVFHEHCDEPEEDQMSDSRLFTIVFVIAFCGMVKSLIRHYKIRWLPEAGGCILVGVLAWVGLQFVPHYEFGFDENMFLRLMVPPIVFEAALSIDKRSFRRHLIPIIIFAVLGTLLSTVLTAYIVNRMTEMLGSLCTSIPFVPALIFGALISSIDPIAVLSVLSNLGMTDTDTIYVLIFGESLLNDGVAIVLFQTLVHFLDDALEIDAAAIWAAAIHFLVVAFGSLAVGLLSGFCCTAYYWAMHGCHTPLVEVLMFLCWAFIPYYICDGVEWSGIVSIVAAGFVMDMYVIGEKNEHSPSLSIHEDGDLKHTNGDSAAHPTGPTKRQFYEKEGHLSEKAKNHIHFVTEINSTLMETAIFAYLGLFLFSSRYHWNMWHAFTSIFACVVSRAVMISGLTVVANWLTNLNRAAILSSLSKLSRRRQELGDEKTLENGDNTSSPSSPPAPPLTPPLTPAHARDQMSGVKIDGRMQIVLLFAGLRGAMSFALVENIPLYDTVTGHGLRLKPELKAMTSASILFTVFMLGGYTFYLMERLGVSPGKGSSGNEDVEMMPLVRKSSLGTVEMLSTALQNSPVAARMRRTRKFSRKVSNRDASSIDSFSSFQ